MTDVASLRIPSNKRDAVEEAAHREGAARSQVIRETIALRLHGTPIGPAVAVSSGAANRVVRRHLVTAARREDSSSQVADCPPTMTSRSRDVSAVTTDEPGPGRHRAPRRASRRRQRPTCTDATLPEALGSTTVVRLRARSAASSSARRRSGLDPRASHAGPAFAALLVTEQGRPTLPRRCHASWRRSLR